jgi:putative membrane protein insertion efficiency factor
LDDGSTHCCTFTQKRVADMEKEKLHIIEVEGVTFECRVDSSLVPGLRRILTGTTPYDAEIDALAIPEHPIWLAAMIQTLRWYRRHISPHFGNRCVFEPSCSHYSELAFRKHGFFRGFILTIQRLCRCRPGTGGVDLP